MKEFRTAAAEVEFETDENGEPILDEDGNPQQVIQWTEFDHDGTVCRFRAPKETYFSMLMAASNSGQTTEEAGAVINLLMALADNETGRYFRRRLWDPEDTFDVTGEGGVLDILQWLLEEWSGRPTKSPTDFKPSRKVSGQRSTASTRVKASNSSTSRRPASSRSSTPGR